MNNNKKKTTKRFYSETVSQKLWNVPEKDAILEFAKLRESEMLIGSAWSVQIEIKPVEKKIHINCMLNSRICQ